MKTAYLCSPYSAPTQAERIANQETARDAIRAAKSTGVRAIAPHAYIDSTNPDIGTVREAGLREGLKALETVDEVWVLEGRMSPGMKGEIEYARRLGKPILKLAIAKGIPSLKPFPVIT